MKPTIKTIAVSVYGLKDMNDGIFFPGQCQNMGKKEKEDFMLIKV